MHASVDPFSVQLIGPRLLEKVPEREAAPDGDGDGDGDGEGDGDGAFAGIRSHCPRLFDEKKSP